MWHVWAVVAYPCTLLKVQGVNYKNPIRILVADDFSEWRVRLRSILQARPEWQVIGEACDGLDAVHKTTELRPDVVLLDIGMPGLNGIEAAKQIRRASPSTKVIFVTQENDAEVRTEALAAGAEGYLLKTNLTRELLSAVEAALGDAHYCPTARD